MGWGEIVKSEKLRIKSEEYKTLPFNCFALAKLP
jgi:hypothetical protein